MGYLKNNAIKKFISNLFLFSSTYFLFGQSIEDFNKKLDSLNLILKEVNFKINEFDKRKNEIQKQISEVIQQKSKLELEEEYLEGIPVAINSMGGTLRDKPSISGIEIIKIPMGDTILIYNWYEKPYFKAEYNEKVGFISYSSLEINSKIESIINQQITEENPRLAWLTKKYGAYNAQKIVKGEYWIGMTDEMAKESIGFPDDINKSTGSWGVHEQWVYSKRRIYLYFENGKLKSTQD